MRRSAIDEILAARVVAIVRRPESIGETVEELLAGGVRVVEVTLDDERALDAIAKWRDHTTVIAGTVLTIADVEAAAEAGAKAVVSPAFTPAVVARALELGVPPVPGCFTPTELENASAAGAPLLKLFPGSALGPGYVKSVLSPLRGLPIMVTGGVTAANAPLFLEAGAVAVGADASRALSVLHAVNSGVGRATGRRDPLATNNGGTA